VLQTIRADANLRDLVVIIVSAVEEMASMVRCIEMGAEDYLIKPFDPVLLRARLQTSLEKKRLRDLERTYLQQELMLRQSEKLATLGKLSAGIAHELNNPAAAAQRSASQLLAVSEQMQQARLYLGEADLSVTQEAKLQTLCEQTRVLLTAPLRLDSLARSDLQAEVEEWLVKQGMGNGWEYAADLVALGYTAATLGPLANEFAPHQLAPVIAWLTATFTLAALAQELHDATGRISKIVRALKSYSYMDQAPMQPVDIHEGLDNTLTMLRHQLNIGVAVVRDYAADLPHIDAYGSELNQVWTNLIDNAIAAMNGAGRLTVRTRQEAGWVVVSIEDTGHGIPEAIQSKIFDPFFTTKAPGAGTGLGLNIAHQIVTQKHRGQITIHSQPGATCFAVRLPLGTRIK
jgi:signal transduction histidine kinase